MIGAVSYSSTQASFSSKTDGLSRIDKQTSAVTENLNADATHVSSKQTISTLSRQLSESASRAEERDRTLSRSELADKAKNILNQVVGDAYYVNKSRHDNEVPKTSDPELLAKAKQATAFVNDAARGGHSIENPFSGLSREQLANVIYDESGTYTVNERHAAWRESYDQEEAWRVKVAQQAMDEYNRTGKLTEFFSEILEHYKILPAIEQAQYPKDYAADLQSKIDLDFNYRTHQAEGKDKAPLSLIEMLFEQSPQPALIKASL
jgi:hypothetical protein